jgi:hypothetical protein
VNRIGGKPEEGYPQISQMNADLKTEDQRRVIDRMNRIDRMKSMSSNPVYPVHPVNN